MYSFSGHPSLIFSSSEQIWRNWALYHLLTNGSSAVNGCRQNESPNSRYKHYNNPKHDCCSLFNVLNQKYAHLQETNPSLRYFNLKLLLKYKSIIHNDSMTAQNWSKSTSIFVLNCFGLFPHVNSALFVRVSLLIEMRLLFPLEKAMLWIEEAVVWRQQCLNNGFVYYKHAAFCFTMHSFLDWHRVDYFWIIVMFLSAVWTLILTAPIHCRGSTGEQVM